MIDRMVCVLLGGCFVFGIYRGFSAGVDDMHALTMALIWIAAGSALSIVWTRSLIAELRHALTDQHSELKWFDSRHTTLRTQVSSLTSELAALRSQLAELMSLDNEIRGSIKELNRRYGIVCEAICSREQCSSQESQLKMLEDRVRRSSLAIGRLMKRMTDLQERAEILHEEPTAAA